MPDFLQAYARKSGSKDLAQGQGLISGSIFGFRRPYPSRPVHPWWEVSFVVSRTEGSGMGQIAAKRLGAFRLGARGFPPTVTPKQWESW